MQEVGAAANLLDPAVQKSYPAISMQDIIGMRKQRARACFVLDL